MLSPKRLYIFNSYKLPNSCRERLLPQYALFEYFSGVFKVQITNKNMCVQSGNRRKHETVDLGITEKWFCFFK